MKKTKLTQAELATVAGAGGKQAQQQAVVG